MKISVFISLLLLISLSCFAQNYDINAAIGDVATQVKDVRTLTDQISQKLTQVKGNIVELNVTTTDSKGKSTNETYRLNLADISGFAVKELVAAKVMYVEVPIKDGDNYIEHNKDGAFKSYDSELRITAYDIDNARELINKLKAAIALAEKAEQEKYNYASLDEVLPSLYASIKSTLDNEYLQSISSVEGKKEKLSFRQEKAGTTSLYEFNLYDIAPATVKVKATGKSLSITLATINAQKVIKLFENDIPKAYTNKLTIYPTDVENAKQIKNLLLLAIQFTLPDQPVAPVPNNTSASDNDNAGSPINNNTAPANKLDLSKLNIEEPEFIDRPYWVKPDASLNNLERGDATIDFKVKGMGYGGSETYYTVFEKQSSVRFKSGQEPSIVVKVGDKTDPSELFILSVADSKGDRRRFLLSSRSMTGSSRNLDPTEVNLEFKKIADGIYEIILPTGLAPGEYSFLPMASEGTGLFQTGHKVKITCFGID